MTLEDKLEEIIKRLDKIDYNMKNIDVRISNIDKKLDNVSFRLDSLELEFETKCEEIDKLKISKAEAASIEELKERIVFLETFKLNYENAKVMQESYDQRWSPRGRPWPRGRPRGQILKSLALASKVKSLALVSRPQVLENWPVLGSRTALFFGKLKFCGAVEKFFGKRFFVEIA